jgi:hypothetical protein
VKIRQLEDRDQISTADLLLEGFKRRNRDYWLHSWQYLQSQDVPEGQPRFGWAMEHDDKIVGVILNLWRPPSYAIGGKQVANLSSWYVKADYRSFAGMLLARASHDPEVIYLNVSPAPVTIPICEAIGFRPYSKGQNVSLPLLAKHQKGARVFQYGAETDVLTYTQRSLVELHLKQKCIGYVAEVNGRQSPLLLYRRKVGGYLPALQLIYVESEDTLRLVFNALGRALLKFGVFVIADAEAKFEFAPGTFYPDKGSRYYRGREAPHVGDLSFTEITAFGI